MAPVPEVPGTPAPARDLNLDSNAWESRVRDAKRWHLLLEEPAPNIDLNTGDRIYGQFTPQEFSHDLSANVPDAGGFSRANPLVQWVGGSVETITFQARLFSEHKDDQTAADKLEVLKNLRIPSPPNTRPPLTRFFWGDAIPGGMQCYVQSLGGIKYDEIRTDGTIRGLSLNISLKRYTPFRIVRVLSTPMEQTPTHAVKDGETYEMIAQREWGDPLLGVVLRRMNPRFPMEKWAPKGVADLVANETIKIFDRSEVTRERIKPTSHIFDEDSITSAENRRYFFAQRGAKTAILPKR
jgi:hypothetical protein